MDDIQVNEVMMRVPTDTFGFIECKLPTIHTMAEVQSLAEKIKKKELQKRYQCKHDVVIPDLYITKSGYKYQECPECGAKRWLNNGEFGPWQHQSKIQ